MQKKAGKIFFIDKELTDAEVDEGYVYPVWFVVSETIIDEAGEPYEISKHIIYNRNGIKSIFTGSGGGGGGSDALEDVREQVNNLEGYVDGAFSDGIINQAEAVAIEKYINQINTEKSDIDNKYNQIYNDSYLSGTPKTNLATDYNNYVSSHTNLINSINTAIADGATTPTEKADVDSKFNSYRLALGVLTTRFQKAIKAIETATVNAIQIGGRNLVLNSKLRMPDFSVDASKVIKLDDAIRFQNTNYFANNWSNIISQPLQIGEVYTFSVKYRTADQPLNGKDIRFYINGSNRFDLNTPDTAGEWRVAHHTFTLTSDNSVSFHMYFSAGVIDMEWFALVKGNKPMIDWTPAPEDVETSILQTKTDSIAASKAYADAQDNIKEVNTKAYADGIVTSAEQRAIQDATNKAEAAKTYAQAQDNLLIIQMEAYVDGEITAEEQARIQSAQNALNDAKAYSDAQDNLAKIAAAAYADGIVDAEEARAIADAEAKMNAAKAHAQMLVDNVEIGGRNLFMNSKGRMPEPATNVDRVYRVDANTIRYDRSMGVPCYIPNAITDVLEIGKEYTFSVKYRTLDQPLNGQDISFYVNSSNSFGMSTLDTGGSWKVTSYPFILQNDNSVQFHIYVGEAGGVIDIEWFKLELGNKATDWTPAPEDIDVAVAQANANAANALAQAQNAQTTAAAAAAVTSFMQTTVDGNVVSTGTLQVGDVNGANAGITGVTDRGRQSVRYYAGTNYAGKNTAPWYIDDYGVEYQFLNGVMLRRRGVVNGNYVDELYNTNGQLAKKTSIINGRIKEEWFNDGILVYHIGEGGIYYVTEIPESFSLAKLTLLSSSITVFPSQLEIDSLTDTLRSYLCGFGTFDTQTNKYEFYRINYTLLSQLYQAGQNVYANSNRQYEGYKNTEDKYDNITNGWYCQASDNWGINGGILVVNAFYVESGKVINNIMLTKDINGIPIKECII